MKVSETQLYALVQTLNDTLKFAEGTSSPFTYRLEARLKLLNDILGTCGTTPIPIGNTEVVADEPPE